MCVFGYKMAATQPQDHHYKHYKIINGAIVFCFSREWKTKDSRVLLAMENNTIIFFLYILYFPSRTKFLFISLSLLFFFPLSLYVHYVTVQLELVYIYSFYIYSNGAGF